MKTLLFIAQTQTSLLAFSGLADRISKFSNDIKVVIYNASNSECKSRNMNYTVINDGSQAGGKRKVGEIRAKLSEFVSKHLSTSVPYVLCSYFHYCGQLAGYNKSSLRFLGNWKPDLVVTNSDRTINIASAMIKNAQPCPCVIIQVGVYGNPVAYATRKAQNRRYSCRSRLGINRYMAEKYPKQVIEVNGEQVLYFEASQILALKKYDVLPESPWGEGSGKRSNILCLSCRQDKSKNQRFVDTETIVTGTIEEYAIVERRKQRETIKDALKKRYMCDSDVVCVLSVPNYAELSLCSREVQFRNVDVILNLLTQRFGRVYVSLHPRSKREDYHFIEEKYNAIILDGKLDEIIVSADYFLAAATSSTLRWGRLADSTCIPIELSDWKNCCVAEKIEGYLEWPKDTIEKTFSNMEYYNVDERDVIDIADLLIRILNGEYRHNNDASMHTSIME